MTKSDQNKHQTAPNCLAKQHVAILKFEKIPAPPLPNPGYVPVIIYYTLLVTRGEQ